MPAQLAVKILFRLQCSILNLELTGDAYFGDNHSFQESLFQEARPIYLFKFITYSLAFNSLLTSATALAQEIIISLLPVNLGSNAFRILLRQTPPSPLPPLVSLRHMPNRCFPWHSLSMVARLMDNST